MNNEMIQRLTVVIDALNNVSVCGKSNLANLSGSIAVLEELRDQLGVMTQQTIKDGG